MRIDDTHLDPVQPGLTRPPAAVDPLRPSRPAADTKHAPADQVLISAEARALAARHAEATDPPATLEPERLAELRRWVHSGAFDDPAVIETIARRLLDAGDV